MKKWEYHIEEFDDYSCGQVSSWLALLGAEGWELVSVSASLRTYFFKRPKK